MFVLYLLALEFLLLKCFHQSCLPGYSASMNRCVRFALKCPSGCQDFIFLRDVYLLDMVTRMVHFEIVEGGLGVAYRMKLSVIAGLKVVCCQRGNIVNQLQRDFK